MILNHFITNVCTSDCTCILKSAKLTRTKSLSSNNLGIISNGLIFLKQDHLSYDYPLLLTKPIWDCYMLTYMGLLHVNLQGTVTCQPIRDCYMSTYMGLLHCQLIRDCYTVNLYGTVTCQPIWDCYMSTYKGLILSTRKDSYFHSPFTVAMKTFLKQN